MTDRQTHVPVLDRATGPAPDPARAVAPIRRSALIAGASILLMALVAGLGNALVLQGLLTTDDPVQNARDLEASLGQFRLALLGMYVVVVLDVVVAWALLQVFSPVDRELARLAAWFRLAYAAVFLVSLGELAGIPDLLRGAGYDPVFTEEQLAGQVALKLDAFQSVWMAGLVLFGVHLLMLGLMAYRSGWVPRVLGVLLAIAGVGYVFDTVVTVFSEGSPFAISSVTFVGEFLLALWLVTRGRSVTVTSAADGGRGHVG